ncbi:MAG: zinc ribbon domain-containing protein [Pseudomonadota bacterium]
MPIYEYVCQHCGHELDALQKIADDPLTDCEACGQPALKRKISAPSFRLKGQGWYETDFKSDKDKRRNLADGGDKPAAGKSDAASGDGAKKTEPKPAKTSSDGDGKAA